MQALEAIRDIAIIILVVLDITLISVLLLIAIQVWRLFKTIARELPTLTDSARQAATTVQGSADFVGTTIARPTIEAIGFLVAARRFLRVLAFGRRGQGARQ